MSEISRKFALKLKIMIISEFGQPKYINTNMYLDLLAEEARLEKELKDPKLAKDIIDDYMEKHVKDLFKETPATEEEDY